MPLVLALLLVAGLAARVPMLTQQSGDCRAFLLPLVQPPRRRRRRSSRRWSPPGWPAGVWRASWPSTRRRSATRPGPAAGCGTCGWWPPQETLLVTATLTLAVPLLLPEVHERYFHVGEVLAVVSIFVDRRFLAVAALVQVATLSSYGTYLRSTTVLSLETAAGFALAAAVGATAILVLGLRGGTGTMDACSSLDSRTPGPRSVPPAAGSPSAT